MSLIKRDSGFNSFDGTLEVMLFDCFLVVVLYFTGIRRNVRDRVSMGFGSASQGLYYGYSGNTFIIATSILAPFPGFFQPPCAQATADNYS